MPPKVAPRKPKAARKKAEALVDANVRDVIGARIGEVVDGGVFHGMLFLQVVWDDDTWTWLPVSMCGSKGARTGALERWHAARANPGRLTRRARAPRRHVAGRVLRRV